MYEKGIRGGMCQVTCKYAEANNKYMKNYDKNKEPSFLIYVDANNLYGWAMSKKLPVDRFKWVGDLSMFTEDFIKVMMKKVMFGYLFKCHINIFRFCLRKRKLINALNLYVV